MSSIPPLTCYGSGVTVEAAREEAANNALKPLLQLGLDRSSALKSLEENQGKYLRKFKGHATRTPSGKYSLKGKHQNYSVLKLESKPRFTDTQLLQTRYYRQFLVAAETPYVFSKIFPLFFFPKVKISQKCQV